MENQKLIIHSAKPLNIRDAHIVRTFLDEDAYKKSKGYF